MMQEDQNKNNLADMELKESEEIFRSFSEQSFVGVYLIQDEKFVYVNPKFADIFGYSIDECLNKINFHDFIHPDDLKLVQQKVRKGVNQEVSYVKHSFRGIKKNGEMIHVEIYGSSIHYKGLPAATGTILDITRRKQAKKALQKSENQLKTIIEHSNELFFLHDTNNFLNYVSPNSEAILGYTPEEMKIKWTELVSDNHINLKGVKFTEAAIKTGKTQKPYLLEFKKKDGTLVFLEIDESPVKDSKGKVVAVSGAARNVTEKILSEKKLAKLQEQIVQSKKMESIATLTGGLAHDFNNILYIIFGNTELALEDIPKEHPAYTKLETIKSANLRASAIIKHLLDFSRKTDQKLKPINAVFLIKNSLNFLRSTIPATIEIREHLTDADIVILANSIQINQVMMQLCTNASQAMKKTGGTLDISVEKAVIKPGSIKRLPDLAEGEYARITISDKGSGIDPEIITQIFDPYFTTNKAENSGMGLSIVHGIVKNHNGDILVDSRPGRGTTITLLFPMVDDKPQVEIQARDKMLCGNESILFVDDEKSIIIMAKIMLKRLGYKVETSLLPEKALNLFQSNPDSFDLVITDMTMPQMTGTKLFEKLRKIRPEIPVILCTGHSSLIDKAKAKKEGFAGYIMKPMSMSRLAKSIREALDIQKN